MSESDPGRPAYEAALAATTVGPLEPLSAPILLANYDAEWPRRYLHEARRIEQALGPRALRLEHVGSTSVDGLPAKPIVDIALEVADSSDEADYVPALEAAGYALRAREPDWFEHRFFRRTDPPVHLHVFSAACPEVVRMVLFRDRLRTNQADRELYLATKRELAARSWKYMQQYADAKAQVVREILARAGA